MLSDILSDQLIYSTVMINCFNSFGVSGCGTGFFMRKVFLDGTNINAIVTNKHVVRNYDFAKITFVTTTNGNDPNDSKQKTICINDLQKKTVCHPDPSIDICLLFVNDEIDDFNKANAGVTIFYRAINTDMVLLPDDSDSLTSIEDVIMIGYPDGIIDKYNNKPVVRKGITATGLKLDYNGSSDFLIDISCFYGSSGSPVFLRKDHLVKEKTVNGLLLDLLPNYTLIGIIHAMSVAKTDGKLVQKEIPTSLNSIVKMDIPLNLGYVTKAYKILEIFDIVYSQING